MGEFECGGAGLGDFDEFVQLKCSSKPRCKKTTRKRGVHGTGDRKVRARLEW